jgi:CBS domain-containing protein
MRNGLSVGRIFGIRITPQEEVNEAFTILTGRDVNQVPVVQDGHLVGMLRRRDVLRWLQLHAASF